MCSAGVSRRSLPLASRADASLRRADASAFSLADCCTLAVSMRTAGGVAAGRPDVLAAVPKNNPSKIMKFCFPKSLRSSRKLIRVFDGFESRMDFYGRSQCRSHTAVFCLGQLNGLRYSRGRNTKTLQDVMH